MKKNIVFLVVFILVSQVFLYAQTYIQGNQVLSFQSIATSTLLNNTNRLTVSTACSTVNGMHSSKIYYANNSEFAGEAYLVNNMVVELVCRLKSNMTFSSLEETKISYKEMFTNTLGEEDLSLQYYDELKSVNNYNVLISYHKFNNVKDFIAIDNQNRYVVMGSVHCYPQDKATAEAFVNTLLNSITFNP